MKKLKTFRTHLSEMKKNKEFSARFEKEMEVLAQQVDFDESVEKTGEEIKQNWWKKNGENFLKGVRR